ncbi:DNA-3-methyladenine glycosylase I [Cytobacillus oceanisediminis]|uniref:DNA-3-methyladenine glycosylase I n=1 Tax=Bacillaceae TaxID=186817 RepID=UPI001CCDD59D|nr:MULTISPECIES: DNA-3-methyladenine glycosylase I [Bacillaceae]MBZ9536298.1 DNA-3-methyladenine glycosylase I [Cytobacillus oceanisediminis]MDU1847695.1 DNA-3-methyladenine glycosylase I [Niallia nealsonii]UTI43550.1 DNA-3-methyladenine glycosylase I [Niallia sp. RD1]
METRCAWANSSDLMREYHDKEWCVPSNNDQYLFEMLVLEGAQAGLSWSIVLKKREAYRKAFHHFDLKYCANLTEIEMENIRTNTEVVKHLLKIKSVKSNAIAIMEIQREYGSFAKFLWSYVDGKPIISNWQYDSQIPAETDLSKKVSKDLKKRGFKFVGPVTIYSYLQAIGVVNDHITSCAFHGNKGKHGDGSTDSLNN